MSNPDLPNEPAPEPAHGRFPERFERQMACTETEWLRWLPDAIGPWPWQAGPGRAEVALHGGRLCITWRPDAPRVIALIRLPQQRVAFAFEQVSAEQRTAFMRRFDLYTQRGGG